MSLHLYCSPRNLDNPIIQEAVRLASLAQWEDAQREIEKVSKEDPEYAEGLSYLAGYALKQQPSNLAFVKTLLKLGLDPNACLPGKISGSVPLLGLALALGNIHGSVQAVGALIEAGALPLKAQEAGYPLLCTALDIEDGILIGYLLAHGIDPNHPREQKSIAKHIYEKDTMETLLEHGLNHETASQWGWHVDIHHVPEGEDILKVLVKNGVNIDAPQQGVDSDLSLLEHLTQHNYGSKAELGLMAGLVNGNAHLGRLDRGKLIEALSLTDAHGEAISKVEQEEMDQHTLRASSSLKSRRI